MIRGEIPGFVNRFVLRRLIEFKFKMNDIINRNEANQGSFVLVRSGRDYEDVYYC